MPASRGNNLLKVKQQNTESIKAWIYRAGPLSRIELADCLGLTPATITNIIGELVAQGLVQELPEEAAPGASRGVGRKPILMDFVPGARLALGISLGRDSTHYAVTELRGKVLLQGCEPVMPDDFEGMTARLLALTHRLKRQQPALWRRLLGIGLVMPGIVDTYAGTVKNIDHARAGWQGQPLAKLLADATGLPVRMENNVRARTRAVMLFHPEIVRSCSTFALCHVSWGIACPIVLRNDSYSGEDAAAGEIGHMVMEKDGALVDGCGRPGSLESFSSTRAILARCRQALAERKDTILAKICANPLSPTLEEVLLAAEKQDPFVCAQIRQAITYLGIALSNIIDFLNPRLLILSGPLFRVPANFSLLCQIVRQYTFSTEAEDIRLVYTDLGEYGGALGAAAACLEKYFICSD